VPKQLHLVMERDVSGNDIAEAFLVAIRQNHPTPEFNYEVNRLIDMMRNIDFKAGDHIYLTHQPGIGLRCNVVGKGDMRAQIEHVGKNIQACLTAAGASTSSIIKTGAYVTDMDAFVKNADMRTRYLSVAGAVLLTVIVARIVWVMTHNTVVRWKNRRFGFHPPRPTHPPTLGSCLIISWAAMPGIVSLAAAPAPPASSVGAGTAP